LRAASPTTSARIGRAAGEAATLRIEARPGVAALAVRTFASRATRHAAALAPPRPTATHSARTAGEPVQRIVASTGASSMRASRDAHLGAVSAASHLALPRAAAAIPLATPTVASSLPMARVATAGATHTASAVAAHADVTGEAAETREATEATAGRQATVMPRGTSARIARGLNRDTVVHEARTPPAQRIVDPRSTAAGPGTVAPVASIGRIAAVRLPRTPMQHVAAAGHLAMSLRAESAVAPLAGPLDQPLRAREATPAATRSGATDVAAGRTSVTPRHARVAVDPLQRRVRATSTAEPARPRASSALNLSSSSGGTIAAGHVPAPLPRAVEAKPLHGRAALSAAVIQRLAVRAGTPSPSIGRNTNEVARAVATRFATTPAAVSPSVRSRTGGGAGSTPSASAARMSAWRRASASTPAVPRAAVQRRTVASDVFEVDRERVVRASTGNAIGARARRLPAHAESAALPRAAEVPVPAAARSIASEAVLRATSTSHAPIGAASMPLPRAAHALPSLSADAKGVAYDGPGLPSVRAIGTPLAVTTQRAAGTSASAATLSVMPTTRGAARTPAAVQRLRASSSARPAPLIQRSTEVSSIRRVGGTAQDAMPVQRRALRATATMLGRDAAPGALHAANRDVTSMRASVGGLPVRAALADVPHAHAPFRAAASQAPAARGVAARAPHAGTPGATSTGGRVSGVAQRRVASSAPGTSAPRTESASTEVHRTSAGPVAIGATGRRALPRMNAPAARADIEVLHAAAVRPLTPGGRSDAHTPSAALSPLTAAPAAPAASRGVPPRVGASSTAVGGSAARAAAQRRADPSAASAPPAAGREAMPAARPLPGAGALRALPRSQAPETADLDVLHRAAVRLVATPPAAAREGGSEPGGTVGGGLGRADLAALLDQAMGVGGTGRAPVQRRGESVTSLPIGGMAGSVAAARAAASDAARRAVEETSASSGSVVSSGNSGGGGGFGGSGTHGGPHLRRSSVELPSRAITARAGARSGGFGGGEPIQRLVDDEAEPELGLADEASGDSDGRRSPAQQEQQLADLLDVLQERILAELERRGGRYRGVF